MSIADKIKNAMENYGSLDEYLYVLDYIDKDSEMELKSEILKGLENANPKSLILSYFLPDQRYESALLSYNNSKLSDAHKIYWMLSLGKIKCKLAFDRIKEYINTGLFNQAFVALADIDLEKTMGFLDSFLSENSNKYSEENPTYKHDSGYNTLVCLLDNHTEAVSFAKGFRAEGAKKKLIEDALQNL
jgi:hypothetical protein